MKGDSHVKKIVAQKKLKPLKKTDPRLMPLLNAVKEWAGNSLSGSLVSGIKLSGSTAKGTALKGKTDLDLLISLKDSTAGTLGEIYESLYKFLSARREKLEITRMRRQNVSIRIYTSNFTIDFVPAKKQAGLHNWYRLHVRRGAKAWTQTNTSIHIAKVKASGRQTEILATKIWRDNHKLDFPSIYLELAVLDALYKKGKNQPALNFTRVLDYLSTTFVTRRIVDPGNTANIISDLLSQAERSKIAKQAEETLQEKYWSNRLW